MKLVVDASVAVKWLVPEEGTEDAERVLASDASLHVPDLVFAEAASALWKRVNRKQLTEAKADMVLRALNAMPLNVHGTRGLAPAALAVSCAIPVTPYDAIYLALAEALDCHMVTADRRLLRALSGTRLAVRARWMGDLP
jgi:predicted nucleic acid-binding protein